MSLLDAVVKLLFFAVIALFSLKVLWNFMIPYEMGCKLIFTGIEEVRSPSAAIIVEWALLIAAALLSLGAVLVFMPGYEGLGFIFLAFFFVVLTFPLFYFASLIADK